jgi:hypothetical protein
MRRTENKTEQEVDILRNEPNQQTTSMKKNA